MAADNYWLRSVLIQLQNLLSDTDRQRLHFLFSDDVPRRIREDSTVNGSLNLMDILIEQGKISTSDLSVLIEACEALKFVAAARFLDGVCAFVVCLLDMCATRLFVSYLGKQQRINGSPTKEPSANTGLNGSSLSDQLILDQPDDEGEPKRRLTRLVSSFVVRHSSF
jgi:hypothetical protein